MGERQQWLPGQKTWTVLVWTGEGWRVHFRSESVIEAGLERQRERQRQMDPKRAAHREREESSPAAAPPQAALQPQIGDVALNGWIPGRGKMAADDPEAKHWLVSVYDGVSRMRRFDNRADADAKVDQLLSLPPDQRVAALNTDVVADDQQTKVEAPSKGETPAVAPRDRNHDEIVREVKDYVRNFLDQHPRLDRAEDENFAKVIRQELKEMNIARIGITALKKMIADSAPLPRGRKAKVQQQPGVGGS